MVASLQVRPDWQSDAQQQQVGVVTDGQLAKQTATTVPRVLEEGFVRLLERRVVVLDFLPSQCIDAGGSNLRDMDPQPVTDVDHIKCAEEVGPHRLNFVVLAPVGIGRAASAGAIDDPSRFVLGEFT